jgi:hypothetical protein
MISVAAMAAWDVAEIPYVGEFCATGVLVSKSEYCCPYLARAYKDSGVCPAVFDQKIEGRRDAPATATPVIGQVIGFRPIIPSPVGNKWTPYAPTATRTRK